MPMKLSEYFEQEGRGAASRLANAIGAYSSDVSDWANERRPVPVKFAVSIEATTNRAVTRQDMFPTDFLEIWPELIGTGGAPNVPPSPTATAPATENVAQGV